MAQLRDLLTEDVDAVTGSGSVSVEVKAPSDVKVERVAHGGAHRDPRLGTVGVPAERVAALALLGRRDRNGSHRAAGHPADRADRRARPWQRRCRCRLRPRAARGRGALLGRRRSRPRGLGHLRRQPRDQGRRPGAPHGRLAARLGPRHSAPVGPPHRGRPRCPGRPRRRVARRRGRAGHTRGDVRRTRAETSSCSGSSSPTPTSTTSTASSSTTASRTVAAT